MSLKVGNIDTLDDMTIEEIKRELIKYKKESKIKYFTEAEAIAEIESDFNSYIDIVCLELEEMEFCRDLTELNDFKNTCKNLIENPTFLYCILPFPSEDWDAESVIWHFNNVLTDTERQQLRRK